MIAIILVHVSVMLDSSHNQVSISGGKEVFWPCKVVELPRLHNIFSSILDTVPQHSPRYHDRFLNFYVHSDKLNRSCRGYVICEMIQHRSMLIEWMSQFHLSQFSVDLLKALINFVEYKHGRLRMTCLTVPYHSYPIHAYLHYWILNFGSGQERETVHCVLQNLPNPCVPMAHVPIAANKLLSQSR